MKNRISAALLALSLLLVLAVPALAADAPGRIMLSWTGDPATTMTVTWTENNAQSAVNKEQVKYSESRALEDASTIDAAHVPNSSAIDSDGARYSATITGLRPGTTYWYSVSGEETWSAPQSFTTAEAAADSFSFLFLGDVQVPGVRANTDWGALTQNALDRFPGIAFGLQAGDIVDSGINTKYWGEFLDAASPVFSRIPFMPTNGNHESNFLSGKPELYLDVFSLPKNGPAGFEEEFYSFDYGNAHIVSVNTWVFSKERKLTDKQLSEIDAWLALDLVTSGATWKIIVTHVPVYPVHSDTTGVLARQHWAGIFEQYGISLMLVGHQHVYSRLQPLTGGIPDFADGITQIMGNSGAKFYDSADETYAARTVYNVSNYEVVSVEGDNLTVQAFDKAGNELDYVTLAPRTGGRATRAEFIDIMYRLAGSPAVSDGERFSDVPANSTYSDAILWARGAGLVSGVGGGKFNPNAKILPEQMQLIADRYAKLVSAAK